MSEKLPPLEKDPAMRPPIDWGIKTDASRVDEYIYTELKMSVFADTGAFLAYRNLSFTDAVSIEIINELDIDKYLGFDSHFHGIVEQVSYENNG